LAFFKASNDVLVHEREITAAIEEFQNLLRVILKAEADELPDLGQAVGDFLDDLEIKLQVRYDRAEFARYLMLPNRPTKPIASPDLEAQ
jgi:hypothetical protein